MAYFCTSDLRITPNLLLFFPFPSIKRLPTDNALKDFFGLATITRMKESNYITTEGSMPSMNTTYIAFSEFQKFSIYRTKEKERKITKTINTKHHLIWVVGIDGLSKLNTTIRSIVDGLFAFHQMIMTQTQYSTIIHFTLTTKHGKALASSSFILKQKINPLQVTFESCFWQRLCKHICRILLQSYLQYLDLPELTNVSREVQSNLDVFDSIMLDLRISYMYDILIIAVNSNTVLHNTKLSYHPLQLQSLLHPLCEIY